MRVSRAWLESMVATGWDARTLSHRLTMAGFEVEAQLPVAGAFHSVVVGRVLACEPHPGADRLKVATVDAGTGENLTIVCGASNVRAGITVPVALVGAELPGGVKIKRAKLRGVESSGMLCSGRELAIGEDAEGLMELSGELPLGANLREVLGLDDVVFEVNFTPNRGDALSLLGLARELSVLSGQPITMPPDVRVEASCEDTIAVTLSAAGAGRFAGRVLKEIRERLDDVKAPDGGKLEIIEIEMPQAIEMKDWRLSRLPASYATFMIMNNAVLLPLFGHKKKDAAAEDKISECFPGREIISMMAKDLVTEGGAFHCIGMHQPK